MTLQEHLMVIAMEECTEVAHRISKALRFGMEQRQQDADDKPEENPGQLSNRERIEREYFELRATLGMIGIDAWDTSNIARRIEQKKQIRIEQYLRRSRELGTLS